MKDEHGLTWPQVADRLGISLDYAKKLGTGVHRSVPPSTAMEWEERSDQAITAREVLDWALEDDPPPESRSERTAAKTAPLRSREEP